MTTSRSTSPEAAPVRAGLYVRISDDRRGDELGVRRQEKLCRDLAAARGWEVSKVYADNDLSAYNGKRRPGYEELLADVRERRIGGVIAWHPDRLYRHPKDLERFVETVEAAGAAVATVTAGELDLATASGRMVARILGAVSRQESEHKGERQKAKHAELAAAGKGRGGGTRPFGFNADRVSIREGEAELIREAAAYVLGGGSLRSLHRDWTVRGLISPAGTPWAKQSVRRMLMSPRIAGLRAHRGVVVAEAEWPAIITREDHEALVAILGDPGRNKHSEPPRRKYLLTGGLARCGRCGAALVARPNDEGKRRYVCSRDYGGCNRCFVLAEPLEEFIAQAVFTAVAGPAFDKARAQAADESTSRDAAELAQADQRLDTLAEQYAGGALQIGAYEKATRKLEARIAKLREAVAAEASGRAIRALPSGEKALRDWWARGGVEARADLIGLVIESVTVGPAARGRNVFDPRRLRIRWLV